LVGDNSGSVKAVYVPGKSEITTIDFNITLMGINEIRAMDVNMYPNPATGFVHINTSVDVEKIQLINISGQLLSEQITSGNKLKSIPLIANPECIS